MLLLYLCLLILPATLNAECLRASATPTESSKTAIPTGTSTKNNIKPALNSRFCTPNTNKKDINEEYETTEQTRRQKINRDYMDKVEAETRKHSATSEDVSHCICDSSATSKDSSHSSNTEVPTPPKSEYSEKHLRTRRNMDYISYYICQDEKIVDFSKYSFSTAKTNKDTAASEAKQNTKEESYSSCLCDQTFARESTEASESENRETKSEETKKVEDSDHIVCNYGKMYYLKDRKTESKATASTPNKETTERIQFNPSTGGKITCENSITVNSIVGDFCEYEAPSSSTNSATNSKDDATESVVTPLYCEYEYTGKLIASHQKESGNSRTLLCKQRVGVEHQKIVDSRKDSADAFSSAQNIKYTSECEAEQEQTEESSLPCQCSDTTVIHDNERSTLATKSNNCETTTENVKKVVVKKESDNKEHQTHFKCKNTSSKAENPPSPTDDESKHQNSTPKRTETPETEENKCAGRYLCRNHFTSNDVVKACIEIPEGSEQFLFVEYRKENSLTTRVALLYLLNIVSTTYDKNIYTIHYKEQMMQLAKDLLNETNMEAKWSIW